MFALNLDKETGRILSATYPEYAPADAVLKNELPTGKTAEEKDIQNWRCVGVNKDYVYDPLPKPEEPEIPISDDSMWAELDAAYQEGVDSI